MPIFLLSLVSFILVAVGCWIMICRRYGIISPISTFVLVLISYYSFSSISVLIGKSEFYFDYFESKMGAEYIYSLTILYVMLIIFAFTVPLVYGKGARQTVTRKLSKASNLQIRVTEYCVILNLLVGIYALYSFVSGLTVGTYFEFVTKYRYGQYLGSGKST